MKKTVQRLILILGFVTTFSAHAANFDGKVEEWTGKPGEKFSDAEANFKLVMKRLRENYVDKNLAEEDLYRAATAGMLAALNSGKENENWNVLLSPRMLEDFMVEKTGKLTGIGATLEFEPKTGTARVLAVLPDSAALKAGLKNDDEILSVNGEKYKGKTLADMVAMIRGPSGKVVHLKVLREDRILNFDIARNSVKLLELESTLIEPGTGLLTIGFFSTETSSLVSKKLESLAREKIKKLVVDLRGNSGGTFDDAVKVGELFLPKGKLIVRTKERDGKVTEYTSHREAWHPEVQLVVLTDKYTASGAELLTGALRNGRSAMVIGQTTKGKWNAQSLETLPNKFAIKYSVLKFESEDGKDYQGVGLKPDLEIDGPSGALLGNLQSETNLKKRINQDPPLKAAIEVAMHAQS